MRVSPPTLVFLAILAISFFVRLQMLDFPLSNAFVWGDGTRDYLVANHILKYGEFPLLGPINLLQDVGIRNSPLYFYLLALMLIPTNHILVLGFINIILQLLVIVLIYLIGQKLFGQKTAVIASALFSFNPEVLHQSDFIWQPNLMHPVALLAFFLLAQGHLTGSVLLLSMSITLHNSAFSYIPAFLFVLRSKLLLVFALLLSSLLFFYSPVILYATKLYLDLQALPHPEYFSNLVSNIKILLDSFNLSFSSPHLFLLISLAVLYFLKNKDSNLTKKWALITLILLILPVIFSSFFNKVRLHYLILSFAPFAILTAKIISSFPRYITALLLILFLKTFTFDFQFLKEIHKPFSNMRLIENIILQVKGDLEPIQGNFQIRTYANNGNVFYYPILDTILLVPLESALDRKLSRLTDQSAYNHIQTGGEEFMVVVCHNFNKNLDTKMCLSSFTKDSPGYAILGSLYDEHPLFLFLAKKHD